MSNGNAKFDISDKEPIFFLNGPNRKELRTGACVSCRDHIFEDNSEMLFCQFCEMSNCQECMYKERKFPRGRLNADGQKPRGNICRLCDRKFIIREITFDTAVNTRKNFNKTQTLEQKVELATKNKFVLESTIAAD